LTGTVPPSGAVDLVCPLRPARHWLIAHLPLGGGAQRGIVPSPFAIPGTPPGDWPYGFPRRPRRVWGTLSTCSRHGDNWLGLLPRRLAHQPLLGQSQGRGIPLADLAGDSGRVVLSGRVNTAQYACGIAHYVGYVAWIVCSSFKAPFVNILLVPWAFAMHETSNSLNRELISREISKNDSTSPPFNSRFKSPMGFNQSRPKLLI